MGLEPEGPIRYNVLSNQRLTQLAWECKEKIESQAKEILRLEDAIADLSEGASDTRGEVETVYEMLKGTRKLLKDFSDKVDRLENIVRRIENASP